MQIGDLRERVSIVRIVPGAPDGGGGHFPPSRQVIARVWARVNPISGRERVESRAVQATAMYRVTIRRRTDLTEADWLIWNGERMNIRFLPRVSSKEPFMTMDCELGATEPEDGP